MNAAPADKGGEISTCCVLVSHSRPRWELRICCSFLLWEQVEREATCVAKTAQIRVLDLTSGLRWRTLKKITNSHWYLINFEDGIIWRLASKLLGCGGKCSGTNSNLYNLSLVTLQTLSEHGCPELSWYLELITEISGPKVMTFLPHDTALSPDLTSITFFFFHPYWVIIIIWLYPLFHNRRLRFS